jgi:20S proteasome alpha/beta subunit
MRAKCAYFTNVVFPKLYTLGEKNKPSSLLAPSKGPEKMYKIDEHVVTVVAGLTSDANILIDNARVTAQRYIYTYQEQMPVSVFKYRISYQVSHEKHFRFLSDTILYC